MTRFCVFAMIVLLASPILADESNTRVIFFIQPGRDRATMESEVELMARTIDKAGHGDFIEGLTLSG